VSNCVKSKQVKPKFRINVFCGAVSYFFFKSETVETDTFTAYIY